MIDEPLMRKILQGFVDDPPDTESQAGFLSAVLMLSNEHLGIRYDDPLWSAADELVLRFYAGPSDQTQEKVRSFTVIQGDKQ